ncbi:unnamed protein product [marine sediment metagenome]|uniref:Uncharacterized protein n=1 Tax=marine sediment metagenome TaxID=412755 RepID=X0Z959_9ZZZZ
MLGFPLTIGPLLIKDKFNYEQEFMDSILPEQEFTIVFPQVLLGILEDQARWRIDNHAIDLEF